jgi:hypothetical protein
MNTSPIAHRDARRLTVALSMFAVPAMAHAQSSPAAGVQLYDRIRVTTNAAARHEGRLLLVTPESLVVVDTGATHDQSVGPMLYRAAVPVAHIRLVELSQGRETLRWATTGALIGGAIAGGIMYVGVSRDAARSGSVPAELMSRDLGAMAAVLSGALGAGVGALIGAATAPEHWKLVYGTPSP